MLSRSSMSTDREANLATVRAALGRARTMQLGLAVFVAAMAWLFTLSLDEKSTIGSLVLVYGMTGFFVLIAAVLTWVALVKNSPARSPLVVALRDRPDDVVWLYIQDIKVMVSGVDAPVRDCNVTAKLADGSTVAITVHKSKADPLMAALTALAPGAVVGFSDELEARFKANPRSVAQG